MPFDRSGDENQCSQPKCPIHSNPTNRTILTLSCRHPLNRPGLKRLRHVRQRRGDHRAIEILHKKCTRDKQGDP
jgi:hypothetical protein